MYYYTNDDPPLVRFRMCLKEFCLRGKCQHTLRVNNLISRRYAYDAESLRAQVKLQAR